MNTTIANEILTSGNKVIHSLNEAKNTLISAEHWVNKEEKLKGQCSFLSIIDGTRNRMALVSIKHADEELGHFSKLLSSISYSDTEKLKNVKLPTSIESNSFYNPKVSHSEYKNYQLQIDQVIASVSDIMATFN